MSVKALFLDRDGVINVDSGYVFQVEHFHFIDGIFELCRSAVDRGYIIIVATNQSGIERGYYTEADFLSLTEWMLSCFEKAGIKITDVLHCPALSGPDRKPAPGMFLKAQHRYGIDMRASLSLGDKERDVQSGRNAGVGMNVLLSANKVDSEADHVIAKIDEMECLL